MTRRFSFLHWFLMPMLIPLAEILTLPLFPRTTPEWVEIGVYLGALGIWGIIVILWASRVEDGTRR